MFSNIDPGGSRGDIAMGKFRKNDDTPEDF